MLNNSEIYLERADFTWSTDSIRIFNTPTRMARQTFFYVQEVGYFFTSPPYFTERANLNSYLIIYTLNGSGKLTYMKNDYALTKGTVAFIDCNYHNFYKCNNKSNWEFLWLHYNGISALGHYEAFIKNNFRILDNLNDFFIEGTMRRILSMTQKKDLHSEFIISNLITNLLTEFLIQNSSKNFMIGIMPEYIKKILKKIDAHFAENITLDSLSHEFGISKYHLSREFKRYVGTPINEHTILTRLNQSKALLKYTCYPINEVSYKCGFNNINHFINLFKSREHCTPLQYRKKWE